MAYDFASDLETMFDTDELAQTATYTHGGSPAVPIPVIFQKEFFVTEEQTEVDMGLADPQARCKTSDVANVANGDALAIDGVTYYVQDVRPSGNGVTLLMLSKDA
ncbi:MAG: hypothetical protein IH577_03525 [Deltaproteobacteria bacterium]|nr:hypothetical protein [Deltaproteobacteria bacterium]